MAALAVVMAVIWTAMLTYIIIQNRRALKMDAQLLAVLQQIDDETNALAAEVNDLKSKVASSMTQEDVDALKTRLTGVANRLGAIASDPAQAVAQAATPPTT